MGTLVFKDNDTREVIIWKHIESEIRNDYIYLISVFNKLGYTIQSVVLDGKRGIDKAFKDIPRQMCQFHMKQIIQRYITMKPKLEANKDLKIIMSSLEKYDKFASWNYEKKNFIKLNLTLIS